jgi:hypothetical protein
MMGFGYCLYPSYALGWITKLELGKQPNMHPNLGQKIFSPVPHRGWDGLKTSLVVKTH